MLVLIFVITITSACSSIANEIETQRFHKWLMHFNGEAEQAGISHKTMYEFMKSATYLPKVIELDRKQPDKVKSFDQYIKAALPEKKIKLAKLP